MLRLFNGKIIDPLTSGASTTGFPYVKNEVGFLLYPIYKITQNESMI